MSLKDSRACHALCPSRCSPARCCFPPPARSPPRAATAPRSAAPRTASRTSRRATTARSASATATRSPRTTSASIADIFVTVSAQRSRYFGPDAESPNGGTNLQSDFFFQRINDERTSRSCSRSARRRTGPRRRCARSCAASSPATTPTCARRAATSCPTRPAAARRGCARSRDRRLPALLPARPARQLGRFLRRDRQRRAARRGASARRRAPERRAAAAAARRRPVLGDQHTLGSNAVRRSAATATATAAACCSATRTSRGTAPSASTRRSSTIPGKLDVDRRVAARRAGRPHRPQRSDLAWSHTVSTAYRFTPYELKLVPAIPTTYLVDGQPTQMTRPARSPCARSPAARPARARSTRPATARSSTRSSACRCSRGRRRARYAMGDANADNFRYLNHFFEYDQAQSPSRARRASSAATRASRGSTRSPPTRRADAYYADTRCVPNVDQRAADAAATTALGRPLR